MWNSIVVDPTTFGRRQQNWLRHSENCFHVRLTSMCFTYSWHVCSTRALPVKLSNQINVRCVILERHSAVLPLETLTPNWVESGRPGPGSASPVWLIVLEDVLLCAHFCGARQFIPTLRQVERTWKSFSDEVHDAARRRRSFESV